MGTSPITPCYDLERLETKTHMGLGPGESIEYTKHRVSLEGHPWPWCGPEVTPGIHIVMDRPSKNGLEQCWSSEPERLLLKQKGLFPPCRPEHPGCKALQMWTTWTSQPPHKCLKWTPHWTQDEVMPLVEWALNSMGHCNPEEKYANVIASTNHLEIICFVTGPPLAWLPKQTKSCYDFLYEAERSMYILRALTGQIRDSWLPVGGENAESVMTWALNEVESILGT